MYGTYVKEVGKCGVLVDSHKKYDMSVSGNSKVGVNRNIIGFYLKLNLVNVVVGGNAEDCGEIHFGEEGIAVVYCGDTHGVVRGINISFIANKLKKLINNSLEISDLIYWWFSRV